MTRNKLPKLMIAFMLSIICLSLSAAGTTTATSMVSAATPIPPKITSAPAPSGQIGLLMEGRASRGPYIAIGSCRGQACLTHSPTPT